MLQCVAVCGSVLQCVVADLGDFLPGRLCCSVLLRVATCCSVLQYIAAVFRELFPVRMCCSVLQCVLQCVAVCCNVLQLTFENSDPFDFCLRYNL